MDASVSQAKAALRREVAAALRRLDPRERDRASESARDMLVSRRPWREAGSVLFFAPTPGEVDLWPLLERAVAEGREVALPRYVEEAGRYVACRIRDSRRDLVTGKYQIREPGAHCEEILIKRLDLILVPGVAFDLSGRRLGRGKGYYDQLLAEMDGTRCGVAFDPQIVREVPVEAHDIFVNCILTPTRWIDL